MQNEDTCIFFAGVFFRCLCNSNPEQILNINLDKQQKIFNINISEINYNRGMRNESLQLYSPNVKHKYNKILRD